MKMSEGKELWAVVYENDEVQCWVEVFEDRATAEAHVRKILETLWAASDEADGPLSANLWEARDQVQEVEESFHIYCEAAPLRRTLSDVPEENYP
jgi:hypothetical protein